MNGPWHSLSSRSCLAAVLAIALLARAGVLLAMRQQLERDPDGYRALAASLAEHGVLGTAPALEPSAYRSPLYPLLLAPCEILGHCMPLGIGLLHLACGVLTVGLTWRLGRSWGLSEPAALSAALLVAVDPILLFYSAQVMTETVATLLAVAALDVLTRAVRSERLWAAAWAGAVAALAALCRPVFLVWLLLATGGWLVLWTGARRAASGPRWGPLASFIVAATLVLSPWVVRNSVDFGVPIITTTHGGYTLLLGNNALYYAHLRDFGPYVPWSADELQRELAARCFAAGADDEVARDRVAYGMAREAIVREPGMFGVACLVRVSRLWGWLPIATGRETVVRRALRYAVAAGYAVELVLAALGLWRLGRLSWQPPWSWGLLMAASFTAVHLVYWADLRMRGPLVPWIALLAAAALWPPSASPGRKSLSGSGL